jgi:methylmalonyl-CoA/ethylmalonyl-CoA epimerase
VHKVLAKRGEFVHHIAFLSEDFGHTVEQCRAAGLPIVLDENSGPDTMPWLHWNFVPEAKAHGVLIELATRYQAIDGRWYPHPGNAENAGLLEELNKTYYS